MIEYSDRLNNSDEHLTNAVIAAYINLKENLSKKEISFIENHINKCDDCKSRLEEMIEEDLEIDDVKEMSTVKKSNKYYTWTAAAMIIIALGIGLYYIFSPKEENLIVKNDKPVIDSSEVINKIPHKNITEDKKPIQENIKEYNESDFAANTVLENFINRNVRSEKTIEIILPERGAEVSTTITFEWKKINSFGSLLLSVVDNKNNPVYEITVDGNRLTIDKNLKPGLYYWKLQSEGKLETVGKFYVKAP